MPRYHVTLEGHLVDVWEVEAASPAEADEKVRKGKGRWVDQYWDENPQTTRIEATDLPAVDPT